MQVRKRVFLRHFILKIIVLPRQTRDKRKEDSKQERFAQVPESWIASGCLAIPATNPTRRMLCGMMRAVDSSVKNMTGAYKRLGIWEQTVVFFSTDNVRPSKCFRLLLRALDAAGCMLT